MEGDPNYMVYTYGTYHLNIQNPYPQQKKKQSPLSNSNEMGPVLSEKGEERIKRSATTNTGNHLHRIPLLLRRVRRTMLLLFFPLFESSLLLRRFPVPGTGHVTAALSPQRRSGGDEMSLGDARYRALRAVLNTVLLVVHPRVCDVSALDGDISKENATGFRALQPKCFIGQTLLNANQDRRSSKQGFHNLRRGRRRVLLVSEQPSAFGDRASEQRARQFPLPPLLFLPRLWGFGHPVCGRDHGVP